MDEPKVLFTADETDEDWAVSYCEGGIAIIHNDDLGEEWSGWKVVDGTVIETDDGRAIGAAGKEAQAAYERYLAGVITS